jgi:fructose-1,6-bisphosphatase/sedoheptulose 1,7-bisphosphatase-like protein
MSNQIGQIGTRIDAITSGDIAADVSSNIEKQIEATMATSIQQEIKRSCVACR